MYYMKQAFLANFQKLGEKEFGGSLLRGHARIARPVSHKRAMHLVMRSSHAKATNSFLRIERAKRIEKLIFKQAKEFGVRVYRYANSGNHLHLLILPRSRLAFNQFVKTISGLIARITLCSERGSAKAVQFWDARPYTKILEWGREFINVGKYILQNKLEAIGFIVYRPRKAKSTA